MRNHNGVQVPQVNAYRLNIRGKDFGIIAGIEQDLLPRVFDQ